MADEMVLDSPVLDVVDDVQDQQVDDQQDDAQQVDDAKVVDAAAEPEGDGRSLPQWIKNLKNVDPAAYKEAKGVFFGKKSMDEKLKDFDLDGTKAWLEETGGRDAISQQINDLRTSKEELDGINEALRTGNTELIQEMAEAHPESFPKLAEAAVAQWAKADPEGWERHHAGVIAATIAQSGIPLFLERMQLYLENGKGDQVLQSIQQLQQWTNSFGKTAAQQPQQRQQQQNPFAEREQNIIKQETQMFDRILQGEVNAFRTPLIEGELKDFIARRPGDNDAKELAVSNIRNQVIQRLAADLDFQKKLDGLYRARDKEGAMRLIKSRETQAIKDIAPKVGRTIYGSPAAAKTVTKPVAMQGRVAQPNRGGIQRPVDKADALLDKIFAR